jgi:hypothetical protein
MMSFKRFLPLLFILALALSFSVGIPTTTHAATTPVTTHSVGTGATTPHQPPPVLRGNLAASPNISLQGGAWSCVIETFAWRSGSTIYGMGYDNCSEQMAIIDMTVTAWYCQPILWGCIFFNQGQMGPGCTYEGETSEWCPRNGAYSRGGISGGQLWAVQTHTCVYSYGGSSACGDTAYEVQF